MMPTLARSLTKAHRGPQVIEAMCFDQATHTTLADLNFAIWTESRVFDALNPL
jgi:hypothetical protein